MIGLLLFVLAILASPIKSKSRLEAENAVVCAENVKLGSIGSEVRQGGHVSL